MTDGLPTTALNAPQGVVVPPHAQTHEVDGDDPVLGPIRILGLVSISNVVNVHSVGYVTTGLTITAFTRGGTVEVEISGERLAVGATAATSIALISHRLTIDNLASYQDYNESVIVVDSAGSVTAEMIQSSTIKWYISNLAAGPHTFSILASDLNNCTTAIYSNGKSVYMQVKEVLPFRRA